MKTPAAQSVEDAPEAEAVRAGTDDFAPGLLGRHVGRSAHDRADMSDLDFVPIGPGHPEIEDLDPTVGCLEPEIGRLDVAMDQAIAVCGGQARGNLSCQSKHQIDRWLAAAFQPALERHPLEVLHGEELGLAVATHLIDRDDMVVLDRRRGLSLTNKPIADFGSSGQFRPDHLQSDRTRELRVLSQKDEADRPLPDQASDAMVKKSSPVDLAVPSTIARSATISPSFGVNGSSARMRWLDFMKSGSPTY